MTAGTSVLTTMVVSCHTATVSREGSVWNASRPTSCLRGRAAHTTHTHTRTHMHTHERAVKGAFGSLAFVLRDI